MLGIKGARAEAEPAGSWYSDAGGQQRCGEVVGSECVLKMRANRIS